MKKETAVEIGKDARRRGYEKVLDYPAVFFAKIAYFFKLKHSTVTYAWIIIQFLSLFLFLNTSYFFAVIAIIIFQFMFVIDLVDGKLFRVYRKQGKVGKPLFPKYLDTIAHYVNDSLLFVFIGYYFSHRFSYFYLPLGMFTGILFLLSKVVEINPTWFKSENEQKGAFLVKKNDVRSLGSTLKSFIFDALRVEHFGSVVFLGIIFDIPYLVLPLYTLVYFFEFARKTVSISKKVYQIDIQSELKGKKSPKK